MTGFILPPIQGHFTMQRNANIEQTSEMNKDFFVISQRVKQIFAVYCKYAKKSKKSAFLHILLVSLQKCSPQSVPRTNFCPSVKSCNILYIKCLQSSKWALKNSASAKAVKRMALIISDLHFLQ